MLIRRTRFRRTGKMTSCDGSCTIRTRTPGRTSRFAPSSITRHPGALGTHPSAYTKAGIEWLDRSQIAEHGGRVANYALHAISLIQPPPSGRVAAVKIGSGVPYLMVEARLMVDQFDAGIPAEGVI